LLLSWARAARGDGRVEGAREGGLLQSAGDVALELEWVSRPVGLAGENRGAVLDDGVGGDVLVGGQCPRSLPLPEGQAPIALSGLGAGDGGLTEDVAEGGSEAELSSERNGLDGDSAGCSSASGEGDSHALGVNKARSVGAWPEGVEAADGKAALAKRDDKQEGAKGFQGGGGAVAGGMEGVDVKTVDVGERPKGGLVEAVGNVFRGVGGGDAEEVGEARQNAVD
jgi:hypothetical protein